MLDKFSFCLLEGLISISSVDKIDVFRMKISDDTHDGCKTHLLICITAQELDLAWFVDDVDLDGITLWDNFVSVEQVRECDSWVFLGQFWFSLIEPFIAVVASIFGFLVRQPDVFEKHSNPLSKSSDPPVPKIDFAFVHKYKICSLILIINFNNISHLIARLLFIYIMVQFIENRNLDVIFKYIKVECNNINYRFQNLDLLHVPLRQHRK